VFGRGFGESLVLHVGDGAWVVVDSFLSPISGRPIALEYLGRLGVAPRNVSVVVASHWHDDHVSGLHEVLSECKNARFVCSAALDRTEFFAVIDLFEDQPPLLPLTSGVAELDKIFDLVDERFADKAQYIADFALRDSLLLRTPAAELYALAPSSFAVRVGANYFGQLLRSDLVAQPTVPLQDPNQLSMVLWLGLPGTGCLLSGDLEASSDKRLGWHPVLSAQCTGDRRASVVKVAHHGSEDADSPEAWRQLAAENPQVAVTAYTKLADPRPRAADRARLKERSANGRVAGAKVGPRPMGGMHDWLLRRITRNGIRESGGVGHIRYRTDVSRQDCGEWTAEEFGNVEPM
jgi:hypothetical protein